MKKTDVSGLLSPSGLKQLNKARAVKCSFFPLLLPIVRSQVSTLQSMKTQGKRGGKLKHSELCSTHVSYPVGSNNTFTLLCSGFKRVMLFCLSLF